MFRKVLALILVCSIALYSTQGTCFPTDLNYPGVVQTNGEVLDVSTIPMSQKKHVYIKGLIDQNNELFKDAISKMKTFTSRDYVMVHIDSNGGSGYWMALFIEAMEKSKATYIAINEGGCVSAAAIIAVQCDVVISLDNTYWLFHMGRVLNDDGTIYISDKTEECQVYALGLMKLAPLTQEEWDRMSNKKFDVMISGDEMNERYGNKAKIILKSTDKVKLERNLFDYVASIYSKIQEIFSFRELQPT